MQLLGEHLAVRHSEGHRGTDEAVGHRGRVLGEGAQHVPEVARIEEPHLEEDFGDLMQAVLEARDDAEVATAASQSPHEIAVLGVAASHDGAVREDDLGGDEVVARQSVLAGEPADAAVERQPGDAGHRHEAERCGEAVLLGRGVELAEQDPRLSPHGAVVGIDVDVLHRRHVDDDAAITDREPGDAVAAGSHRHGQTAVPSELDRGDDVLGVAALGDERRAPMVEHGVVDLAGLVVVGVAGPEKHSIEVGRIDGGHGAMIREPASGNITRLRHLDAPTRVASSARFDTPSLA